MVTVSTKVLAAKWKYNNYPLLCSLHDLQLCSKSERGTLHTVTTKDFGGDANSSLDHFDLLPK